LGDIVVWNYIRYLKEYASPCEFDYKLVLQPFPTIAAFYDRIDELPAIVAYKQSAKCYPNPPPPEYTKLVGLILGW